MDFSNAKTSRNQSSVLLNKIHKTSRKRTVFTTYQVMELEREYQREKYLSSLRRSDIAIRLNLSQKVIKIWFQNRRRKSKTMANNNVGNNTGNLYGPDDLAENNKNLQNLPFHQSSTIWSRLEPLAPSRAQSSGIFDNQNHKYYNVETNMRATNFYSQGEFNATPDENITDVLSSLLDDFKIKVRRQSKEEILYFLTGTEPPCTNESMLFYPQI